MGSIKEFLSAHFHVSRANFYEPGVIFKERLLNSRLVVYISPVLLFLFAISLTCRCCNGSGRVYFIFYSATCHTSKAHTEYRSSVDNIFSAPCRAFKTQRQGAIGTKRTTSPIEERSIYKIHTTQRAMAQIAENVVIKWDSVLVVRL
jgi:hypothetical protein